MRSHILAVAVVAGLGLASSPYAHAQSSKKAKPVAATSSTATEIEALKARGHTIRIGDQTSGLHGIERIQVGGVPLWFGGADPRREGVAKGD